jgi:hypothetical protein
MVIPVRGVKAYRVQIRAGHALLKKYLLVLIPVRG